MSDDNGFTPTQRRMMKVLGDGLPHTRHELRDCFNDDRAADNNTRVHLTALRKKLRPQGKDILVEYVRSSLHYRLIQRLDFTPDSTPAK